MFSYLLYSQYLSPVEPYWTGFHVGVIRLLGLYLDLLVVFVLVGAWVALAAARPGSRDRGYAGLLRIRGLVGRIDRATVILGGVFLVIMVLVTFFSVIGRNLWMAIPDDITFAEWSLVACVALMLGATQGRGEHIEITVLSDHFPRRYNQMLRLIAMLVGAAILTRFGYVNLAEVPDAFFEDVYGSINRLPQWPPRLAFFIGIAWWIARILVQSFTLMALEWAARDDATVLEKWRLSPLLTSDEELKEQQLSTPDFDDHGRSASTQTAGGHHGA